MGFFLSGGDLDDDAFNRAYRRWHEGKDTQLVSEEIERQYRQTQRHKPTICPHGRTVLTCSDCYFSGWRGD